MPQSELTNILSNEFEKKRQSSKEKHDFILYHPMEAEQMLLPETAGYLAVKTYFKMLGVPLLCEARPNAEFMSPEGRNTKLPILQYGKQLAAEFGPIVKLLEAEGYTLWPKDYDEHEKRDWSSLLMHMDNEFTNSELFVCWIDDNVRKTVTNSRYGSPYSWPLNRIQPWRKYRQVKKYLVMEDWLDFDIEMVSENIKLKCKYLSEKLQDRPYFNGKFATEFDALIFGHLYAIITTNINNVEFAEKINQKSNLTRFCMNIEEQYYSRKPSH